MSSLVKKLRKKQINNPINGLTPEQKILPVGEVIGEPIKGTFQAMPVFGWVGLRKGGGLSLYLAMSLLDLDKDEVAGGILVQAPLVDSTIPAAISTLQRLGWDGTLSKFSGAGAVDADGAPIALSKTLNFVPLEHGYATVELEVLRSKGPFLMPPLSDTGDSTPELVEAFNKLRKDHSVFFK